MKKLMLIAALAALSTAAFAQKTEEATIKAVASAKAACNDAKKSTKLATWLNAAKVNLEAYTAPQGNGVVGISRTEIAILLNGKKPTETITKKLGDTEYLVDVYPTVDYYYQNNALKFMITTKPYVKDALETALNAYTKASELDVKGSKTKEIQEGIRKIANYYQGDAINAYTFGQYAESSALFQKAFDTAGTAPLSNVDTSLIYNAGLTAYMAGNMTFAGEKMEECLKYNYYENGEVFAKLAEVKTASKDTTACKAVLEKGFEKFPENQRILVGLINLYIETKDNPEKLFNLLNVAKKNEPDNASIYYVEGNLYKQLGDEDKAIEAYDKCAEINPKYEHGYIGKGMLFYDKAEIIRQKAETEFDDKKYQALVEEYDATLAKSIENFEKAFNITENQTNKVGLAEYLKAMLFRFRDKDDASKAAYEKYSEIVKNNS